MAQELIIIPLEDDIDAEDIHTAEDLMRYLANELDNAGVCATLSVDTLAAPHPDAGKDFIRVEMTQGGDDIRTLKDLQNFCLNDFNNQGIDAYLAIRPVPAVAAEGAPKKAARRRP